MEELANLINLIPGYISVINLDGKYLAFNNKLNNLMKISNLLNLVAGQHCAEQIERINYLILSPVGTQADWEYSYEGICLAISSVRQEDYILNIGVDITSQKQLEEKLKASEERNQSLLKAIPETMKNSGRRKNNELENLISLLTEKPIVSQNISESLIRLEVELRQNSTRLSNIERLLFLDEKSLIMRIKELEIRQEHDGVLVASVRKTTLRLKPLCSK